MCANGRNGAPYVRYVAQVTCDKPSCERGSRASYVRPYNWRQHVSPHVGNTCPLMSCPPSATRVPSSRRQPPPSTGAGVKLRGAPRYRLRAHPCVTHPQAPWRGRALPLAPAPTRPQPPGARQGHRRPTALPAPPPSACQRLPGAATAPLGTPTAWTYSASGALCAYNVNG